MPSQPVTKQDLERTEQRLDKRIDDWGKQIMLHAETVAEHLLYDVRGILSEKEKLQDDRLLRLERHVGLKP
jgi:hypothetical protein